MSETWTVKRILDWATEDFRTRGMETPRLEAELLLSGVLGCDRIALYTGFDRPLDVAERERFKEAVIRRRGGEPAAYILGVKEFWSLDFQVDPSVLVPRPETELLVELGLEDLPEGARVLDLCTGSGCVAVALAHERPDITVDAADLSPQACATARRNVAAHGLEDRVTVLEGDLFAPAEGRGPYRLIVSNPPYVRDGELSSLSPEVRREPPMALISGQDGLDAVRRILRDARRFMGDDGRLLVEMDPRQTDLVAGTLGPELMGLAGTAHRDLAGLTRVVSWNAKPKRAVIDEE